jgi:hypothetical protein
MAADTVPHHACGVWPESTKALTALLQVVAT